MTTGCARAGWSGLIGAAQRRDVHPQATGFNRVRPVRPDRRWARVRVAVDGRHAPIATGSGTFAEFDRRFPAGVALGGWWRADDRRLIG